MIIYGIDEALALERLRAYGTSEGVSRAWDSRGRGRKLMVGDRVNIRHAGRGRGTVVSTSGFGGEFHLVKGDDGKYGYYHESDLSL